MVTAAPTQPAEQTAQAKQAAAVEAYAQIHERVYAPAFFHKLASDYGIQPANDDEAYELMTMATKLRAAHDATQQKQAQAAAASRQSFLKTAHQHLDSVLQQQGLAAVQQPVSSHEAEIKSAAATLTLDPVIAQAVLQLQVASR